MYAVKYVALFLLLGVALAPLATRSVRFMHPTRGRRKLAAASAPGASRQDSCPQPAYLTSEPTPDAVFDHLTPEEYMSVAKLLVAKMSFVFVALLNQDQPVANVNSVNLLVNTSQPSGGLPDYRQSTIYNIILLPPDKAEALAHLEGQGPPPARYAQSIVIRGAHTPPDTMVYKVGPLPLGPSSGIHAITAAGEIPWIKRPQNDYGEQFEWADLLAQINKELTPLFLAVTGQCTDYEDAECQATNITQEAQASWVRETGSDRIKLFFHFLDTKYGGSGDGLFPIPIAFKFNLTDVDSANWYAFDFEHCTQGFDTAAEMIEALNDGSLKICDVHTWSEPTYNSMWSDDVPQGPGRAGSNIPGPRLYEPAGKRFQLGNAASPSSRTFSWMGWEGHVTTEPWRGIQLHNIKFGGERILYELSLQDQLVAYSGYQSIGQSFYFDSVYQLGGEQYTLRPGYDCPETAAYMDVDVMAEYGQMVHFKGGVCFFESQTDTTAWRHFDYEDEDVSTARDRGVRNYEFVIRTIASIANYDYVYDIRFKLDGELDVRVFMAGYMQSTYFDDQFGLTQKDHVFGTCTHEKTLSNIHDHYSSWKIDFDINGTANNFHKTTLKAGTYDQIFGPGSTPSYSSPSAVFKYADDALIETEQGWKLNFSEPSIFTVSNDKVKNAWGNARSYGIFHQYTAPQLLPDDHPLLQAAAWAKYNLAVTKRKENESVASTDYFDMHGAIDPITSLDKYLDNEAIEGQDLVAWLSMGIIHVPRGEDVPVISNVGSEFQMRPINFFDQLASLDIVESDDFEACIPQQGNTLFDYTWNAQGENSVFDKHAFTLPGNLPQPKAVGIAAAG